MVYPKCWKPMEYPRARKSLVLPRNVETSCATRNGDKCPQEQKGNRRAEQSGNNRAPALLGPPKTPGGDTLPCGKFSPGDKNGPAAIGAVWPRCSPCRMLRFDVEPDPRPAALLGTAESTDNGPR